MTAIRPGDVELDQKRKLFPSGGEAHSAAPARVQGAARIRIAAPSDVPQVAGVLGDAFFNDPVCRWIVPEDSPRREAMYGFFRVGLETLWVQHGLVLTTEDATGAAVWLPPGHAQPAEDEAADAMAGWASAFGDHGDALERFMTIVEEGHPHEPHYYLLAIGTRPALQSRGIGSALIWAVLDRCDTEAIPAYLEATTERSRDLYQRHGFETIAQLELPGGPTLYGMWREPRGARAA
jgi:ribosomal protein S18 acetylase RimI-like enzyme